MFPTRETPSRLEPIEHFTSDTKYIGDQSTRKNLLRGMLLAWAQDVRLVLKFVTCLCVCPPLWSNPFPAELTSSPPMFVCLHGTLKRRAKAIQPLNRGAGIGTKDLHLLNERFQALGPLLCHSSRIRAVAQPPTTLNATIRRQLRHRRHYPTAQLDTACPPYRRDRGRWKNVVRMVLVLCEPPWHSQGPVYASKSPLHRYAPLWRGGVALLP